MYKSMKNYIKHALVAAFAVVTLALGGAHAYAATAPYVAWNNASNDCPTVSVANDTTQENAGNICWGSTVSAQPGDTINVRIYYHNTGNANAGNTIVKLNMPTGTQSAFSFTGYVSGGSAQALGSGNINLSSAETLTLSHVAVFKDQSISPAYVSGTSLFTSGLSLGQIDSANSTQSACPASNSFCHQGAVVASFIVGGTNNTTNNACAITSFTPSQSSVTAGSSSTLTWNTTGCNTVTISGVNGTYGATGSVTVTPSATTTYTLTATGTNTVTQSTTVAVNQQQTACLITSFYANPTQVAYGNSSTLAWNTTGCTSVSVSGAGVSSSQLSGTASTGAIYGTTVYTITASGSNTATQSVTVSSSTNNQNLCAINSFYASPSQVTYGASTTIYWNTTGCTSATLSGNNASGSGVSSSVVTGPVYGPSIYTLTAYGSTGQAVTQTLSISAINTNYNTQSCYISNVYASPAQVSYGGTTTLYWSNTNGGAVTISGGNLASTYQYGTSITTGPIYNTTTYTITPINCNGGYAQSQSITVYVNGNNNNQNYGTVTAITTLADNVSSYSARLNGLLSGSTGGSMNAYFEYGTTQALGQQTTQQLVTAGSVINYFDTISTTPNTTYYYRAAAVVNGTVYRGSIIAFTTPATVVSNGGGYVAPVTYVTTTKTRGVGGGSEFLSLSITDTFQSVTQGDEIVYTINYKNITDKPLTGATLNVLLPAGVTFHESTAGILTTDNTVVTTIGTIDCGQMGTETIEGTINDTVVPGSTLVATADMGFTVPSGAQDSAVAYAVNTVAARSIIGGAFGNGFFPSTLLGWILLIAIIILIILLIRHFSTRRAPVIINNGRDYHDTMH